MRPLALLAVLGFTSVDGAAHATGMLLDAALANVPVVASAEPARGEAETGPGELLRSVGFRRTHEALDAWSTSADGEALLPADFGASEPGAATAPRPACSDSLDNDGDGLTDFPDDPGCLTQGSVTEQPRCQDGIDSDGDGAIDFDGGASLNGGVPLAAPDPQCEGAPWRYVERP